MGAPNHKDSDHLLRAKISNINSTRQGLGNSFTLLTSVCLKRLKGQDEEKIIVAVLVPTTETSGAEAEPLVVHR